MPHLRAFTLIEMSITLFIMAILIAVSIPSVKHLLTQTEDDMLQETVLSNIEFAHQSMLAHHQPIAICQSINHVSCATAGDLQVFVDTEEDGIVHNKNQLLSIAQLKPSHAQLHWRFFPRNRAYLQFSPDEFANGTIWYCRATKPVWAIVINKMGRARVMMRNAAGKIKDGRGEELGCNDPNI